MRRSTHRIEPSFAITRYTPPRRRRQVQKVKSSVAFTRLTGRSLTKSADCAAVVHVDVGEEVAREQASDGGSSRALCCPADDTGCVSTSIGPLIEPVPPSVAAVLSTLMNSRLAARRSPSAGITTTGPVFVLFAFARMSWPVPIFVSEATRIAQQICARCRRPTLAIALLAVLGADAEDDLIVDRRLSRA